MSLSVIPLTTSPNQTLNFKITIGGENKHLQLFLRYLQEYKHWIMDVSDASTGDMLISALPLVPGKQPAANILASYAYLHIGEAYLVKYGDPGNEYPDSDTLGASWLLLWGELES